MEKLRLSRSGRMGGELGETERIRGAGGIRALESVTWVMIVALNDGPRVTSKALPSGKMNVEVNSLESF